jgi:anti-sigma B factor antagonist
VNISQHEVEGVVVLELTGRLVAGDDCTLLRDAINTNADADRIQIVLNLQRLDFIDSTGLGTLVICYTRLQQKSGALKLACLSKRHIELLVLTKLTTIFEIFDTEQAAVNSFFANREVKKFDILEFVKSQTEP